LMVALVHLLLLNPYSQSLVYCSGILCGNCFLKIAYKFDVENSTQGF